MARPKGFEPLTSAFGELWIIPLRSIFGVFACEITQNATQTSGDYADNLRTPPDVLCGFPLVVGMMMPINPL